jgi:hypothetical protein
MSGPSELYQGAVVFLYAFDVAFEMERGHIDRLLGAPLVAEGLIDDKRNPRRPERERALVAQLPPIEIEGPAGPLRIERRISVMRFGAISVRLRVPVEGVGLAALVKWHDLRLASGSIHDLARTLATSAHQELMPVWIRPRSELPAEEAYTVFCLETPVPETTPWFSDNRRAIAALLTQEADASLLSEQEVMESTIRTLSYYRHDLAVLDWDAALLVDRAKGLEETLGIIELANLTLAELEAYDEYLDSVVELAYRDVGGRNRRGVLRALGELRIDLARTSDALGNITKFFGDWHLARVYAALGDRFHLSDWQRTTDAKLRMVDGIYQVLKQDQNNRWMIALELTVVALFIADLVIVLRLH